MSNMKLKLHAQAWLPAYLTCRYRSILNIENLRKSTDTVTLGDPEASVSGIDQVRSPIKAKI